MKIEQIVDYLKSYDGRELKIMEVCGTHTASIFKNGIRSLISPKIRLISRAGMSCMRDADCIYRQMYRVCHKGRYSTAYFRRHDESSRKYRQSVGG